MAVVVNDHIAVTTSPENMLLQRVNSSTELSLALFLRIERSTRKNKLLSLVQLHTAKPHYFAMVTHDFLEVQTMKQS